MHSSSVFLQDLSSLIFNTVGALPFSIQAYRSKYWWGRSVQFGTCATCAPLAVFVPDTCVRELEILAQRLNRGFVLRIEQSEDGFVRFPVPHRPWRIDRRLLRSDPKILVGPNENTRGLAFQVDRGPFGFA